MTNFQMPVSVTQEMIRMAAGYPNSKDEDPTTVEASSIVPNIGKMAHNFNTKKANLNMDFLAYAIQAEGFDNIEAAYEEVPFKEY